MGDSSCTGTDRPVSRFALMLIFEPQLVRVWVGATLNFIYILDMTRTVNIMFSARGKKKKKVSIFF